MTEEWDFFFNNQKTSLDSTASTTGAVYAVGMRNARGYTWRNQARSLAWLTKQIPPEYCQVQSQAYLHWRASPVQYDPGFDSIVLQHTHSLEQIVHGSSARLARGHLCSPDGTRRQNDAQHDTTRSDGRTVTAPTATFPCPQVRCNKLTRSIARSRKDTVIIAVYIITVWLVSTVVVVVYLIVYMSTCRPGTQLIRLIHLLR